eukprot:TRINITY_DN1611_c0_g1_i3.p1 TRINITY_DN1611_c0_g1~~TRINITY_DN1611_c0_g1_i3.p1  ORF type:complete len:545 (+),score=130.67 TRINITY_DN1611_c0_g1_i3:80-1714(+)
MTTPLVSIDFAFEDNVAISTTKDKPVPPQVGDGDLDVDGASLSFTLMGVREGVVSLPVSHPCDDDFDDSDQTTATEGSAIKATTSIITEEEKGWATKMRARMGTFSTSVKQVFVSPETEDMILQVRGLINQFFKDVPYSAVDVMFGIGLMRKHFISRAVLSGETVTNTEMVDRMSYYMRFASACFGAKFIYGFLHPNKKGKLMAGLTGSNASNQEALSYHTGVRPDDLLTAKWTSSNFDPGHYVCVDHTTKSIVVSIRGTFHARDTLTDLVATTTPFMGGYAHKGILQAAKRKHALLAPIVLDALVRYHNEYSVVVCGHSLGAGVAALFTLLFHEIDPEVPIHCYAFASPCVLSPELAMSSLARRIITTVVVADDVVPRLCYPTLDRLKRAMCAILGQSNSTVQRAFQWAAAGNPSSTATIKVAGLLKCPPSPKVQEPLPAEISDLDLLPPGNVYHIHQPHPAPPYLETLGDPTLLKNGYEMEMSSPSLFNEVIVSDTMFSDHMPNRYEAALMWTSKVLKALATQQASTATTTLSVYADARPQA